MVQSDSVVLDMGQVAQKKGISKGTLRQYIINGEVPTPDGYVSGAPWWSEATIGDWLDQVRESKLASGVVRDHSWDQGQGRSSLSDKQILDRLAKILQSGSTDMQQRAMYMAILWHRGWTVRAIGEIVGLTGGRVHQLVQLGRELLAETTGGR